MSRPPRVPLGGAGMTCGATKSSHFQQSKPAIQTDLYEIVSPPEEKVLLAKAIATCRARLALAGGAVLAELSDGSLLASAGGFSRHFVDVSDLQYFLRQVEGRKS